MNRPTIFDEKIWGRMLEKHPDLKELAIEVGVLNNPERARKIYSIWRKNFGIGKLSKSERELAISLCSMEFAEQGLVRAAINRAITCYSARQFEEALDTFEFVLDDFYWSYEEFWETCKKRFACPEDVSFAVAYEIYIEILQLKPEEIRPSYIKLFVKKLLEIGAFTKSEIQKYFADYEPNMLQNLSKELLEDVSD